MDTIQVYQWASLQPGPKLIVLGAVHGNETCGTAGIKRVVEKFQSGEFAITRGQVTFVPISNPKAFRLGKREGDRNLNRDFRPSVSPETAEDSIANFLAPLLASHDVLVDLHSFTSQGEPFIFIGPQDNQSTLEPFQQAASEEALAAILGPKRIVHGWMSAYASGVARRKASGTPGALIQESVAYGIGTTEYMRALGGAACTVECGNHADANAPEIAYQAICNALAHLQLIDAPKPVSAHVKEVIELAEVFDRRHADDKFTTTWRSFDQVAAGTAIAIYANGSELIAPETGYVVFPNPNTAVGREWFYFGRPSQRFIP